MNPDRLPDALYTADQVRELDRIAIEEEGIPGLTLMRRAARACLTAIENKYPGVNSVSVFCGSGNNAGDGYILAGMLAERGCEVHVIVVGDPDKLGEDATAGWEYCQSTAAGIMRFDADKTRVEGELVVDALLGTGLKGDVRDKYRDAIDRINDTGCPVVSVDIPSGLCANTGSILGNAIRASLTVTFIGLKRGLITNEGPERCGELQFAGLGVPDTVYQRVEPDGFKLAWERGLVRLPARRRNAHKRDFGHVLIVGGDRGMGGAVAMAGEAALRAGAGLVSLATHPAHAAAMISRRPELMTRAVESAGDLAPLLERATTLIVGPGLGTGDWSREMFDRVLAAELPMVIDADGLNLLSERDTSRDNWILTPHPGEASRMMDGADVRADRYESARQLQGRYGGVVVLKGAGSLIAGPGGLRVCPWGNPGMSSAGMGDVLSGLIGAVLAQGLDAMDSAILGVCVHALAGDRLARADGERGLIATDLIPVARQLLNEIK